MNESRAMQELIEASGDLTNPYLSNWVENGGKVLGYPCCHVPVEIINAAGLLPYRLRAKGDPDMPLSEGYISSVNCSFTRYCFENALIGEYDSFIDGVILVHSCAHVTRLYDNWRRKVKIPIVEFIATPRKIGEAQVEFQREEFDILRKSIEQNYNLEISDEKLWEAIKLQNETRSLQMELYELRKMENPPITGSQMLAVSVASTAMPIENYNLLLKEILDDLSDKEGDGNYRARLMIVGGLLDDPGYLKVIEGEGALIVTDSLCFGSRTLWKSVDEEAADPLGSLARYYVEERPSCPRVFGDYARRLEFIKEMIEEFRVDGVIFERIKFCDTWGGETFSLIKDLKEEGVPVLELERDYLSESSGQLRTRAQAFIETIE